MLLTREEMSFDFRGAKLDPVKDKDVIVWAVQQFLYGEITGIQIGPPDLEAARFLARQAAEEFRQVGNFLRILEILDSYLDDPLVRGNVVGAQTDADVAPGAEASARGA